MEEIWVLVATATSFKEQTMGGGSVGEVPLASPLGTLTLTQVLPLAKTLNPASFSFFRHLLQMQSHRERGSKLSQWSPARTHLNLMGFNTPGRLISAVGLREHKGYLRGECCSHATSFSVITPHCITMFRHLVRAGIVITFLTWN